jgi:glutaminase
MTSSLIRPDLDIADRFDLVAATWARLAGGGRVGFNNAVYLSERQTADRNFALGITLGQ